MVIEMFFIKHLSSLSDHFYTTSHYNAPQWDYTGIRAFTYWKKLKPSTFRQSGSCFPPPQVKVN